MADREKVIKGLELCQQGFDCPEDCPYLEDCDDMMKPTFIELAKDALALLKEQDAVEPTWQQGKAYCGSCGKRIPLKIGARYCHKCGRAVNWFCADGKRKDEE